MTADPGFHYLLRLTAWGFFVLLVAGFVVELGWRMRADALAREHPAARHRAAVYHFVALAAAPLVAVVVALTAHLRLGAVVERAPPTSLPLFGSSAGGSGGPALLAVAWLTGVAVMTLHLFVQHRRLRAVTTHPASPALQEEVARVAALVGCRRAVRVRVGDVSVPQVTGAVHPTLLVPCSLLRLPHAERHAVLLHELAHVVRNDLAVNLVQRFVLALTWPQPVAWAMYRRIAREREACCDRLAVDHGASRAALARSLVALAPRSSATNAAMAMAAPGTIAWRLGQLASAAVVPARSERLTPFAVALLLCLAGWAGLGFADRDERLMDLYVAGMFGPAVAINAHDPAGRFGLLVRRGRVVEASIADRPLGLAAIRQRGAEVMLLDSSRAPLVTIRVSDTGRVVWKARTPIR